jgi:serine/threonine protein phosphatase 1
MDDGSEHDFELTYAIGDIHGRLDLLRHLRILLFSHAKGRSKRVIFLGDYIDRGPQSCAVIEYLMEWKRRDGLICLKGNHEEMLLQARQRRQPEALELWLRYGGSETLQSYGATAFDLASLDLVPPHHVEWLACLPSAFEDRDRIFVHAGLAPQQPLRRQTNETLLWIRDRFLKADGGAFPDGKHIVHGHTPIWAQKPHAGKPELLSHRTNVDTAAFATGVLTVAVFTNAPGGPVECLSVRGAPLDLAVVDPDEEASTAAPTPTLAQLPRRRSGGLWRSWTRSARVAQAGQAG